MIGFGLIFSSYIWARVPVYGEPLQQEKGTRPKNCSTGTFDDLLHIIHLYYIGLSEIKDIRSLTSQSGGLIYKLTRQVSYIL